MHADGLLCLRFLRLTRLRSAAGRLTTGCAALCLLLATACAGGGDAAPACNTDGDCGSGQTCVGGRCVSGDAGMSGPGTPTGASCATAEDCQDDSFCEDGRCFFFGRGSGRGTQQTCQVSRAPGVFGPSVQCEFTEAPVDDPFSDFLSVLGTPMVVDFETPNPDAAPRPSIIAIFDDGDNGGQEGSLGVIRILDGRTCTQQAELGSIARVSSASTLAVGDLTGDARAEIIGVRPEGGLVAFTRDNAGTWSQLWVSTQTNGGATTEWNELGARWAGPSLYDLDDDGTPEILLAGNVFNADGRLLDGTTLGFAQYAQGVFGVVADVDGDNKAEWVGGEGVFEWDGAAGQWKAEAYSPGGTARGLVAIADFGDFPGNNSWPANTPEVVVISTGQARVQTLDGQTVFGPVALPDAGTMNPGIGGPPTVADFDGDGRPEFASAGGTAYSVFDLDCVAGASAANCQSGSTDGVLWSRRSQDASSNVTGSSVFDFEGDGKAEVVYGDECFLRVYDGQTGDVVFSQFRTSCTWYENPVIADVDGDFNAEIVIGNNNACGNPPGSGTDCTGFGLDPRMTDPLFAGLRCDSNEDCVSGSCVERLCRCQADTDCCTGAGCVAATGYVCEEPPTGTAGTGKTCRAARPAVTRGLRVYQDGADRWVRSRTIWNQHAYHVTNVDERGRIPRLRDVEKNWATAGLNNFRQNVQGDAVPGAAPDLTVGAAEATCQGADATLSATVCNRGSEPTAPGIPVTFSTDASTPVEICVATSTTLLNPGVCETVNCTWTSAKATATAVLVEADAAKATLECFEGNNRSTLADVACGT